MEEFLPTNKTVIMLHRKSLVSTVRSSPTAAASGQWQEDRGHNDLAAVLFTECSGDE